MTDPRIEAATSRLLGSHPTWFKALTTVQSRKLGHPKYDATRSAAQTLVEAAIRACDEVDETAGIHRISLREAIDNVAKSEWIRQHAAMDNPPSWASASESARNVFRHGATPMVTLALTGRLP